MMLNHDENVDSPMNRSNMDQFDEKLGGEHWINRVNQCRENDLSLNEIIYDENFSMKK